MTQTIVYFDGLEHPFKLVPHAGSIPGVLEILKIEITESSALGSYWQAPWCMCIRDTKVGGMLQVHIAMDMHSDY